MRCLLQSLSSSYSHRDSSWDACVTQLLSDIFYMTRTNILKRFLNPLLLHLFFDIVSFVFVFIFNSSSVHRVLGKVSKLCTNKTSSSCVSFPHVMFHTILSNVPKFSIVVASTPCVVVPSKYSFYNPFRWIQFLSFAF